MTTSERRRKRTSNDPQLVTIYWRDIPAQVTARAGRQRASVALDHRFQVAIDGAATRAGMTDNDDYLGEWREERIPCGEDLENELEKRKSELEAEFSPSVLREYVRTGGWAPEA